MPISNKNNANNLSGSKLKINSGTIIKPTITYNTGLGTITISEGIFRLYNTTNYTGLITEYTIPETTLATTDMVTNYLIAQYNDGNPQYVITLNLLDINWSNNTPVYTIARIGDGISVIDWDEPGLGLSNKIHRRLIETRRFERASGLTLEVSDRHIIINTGKAWEGSYSSSFPTVDSSIDTMLLWVNNGDGTFSNSIVTQFPNTQYDPKTGTLSTLTDGKYAVIWVYRCMCRPDIDSARIHIFLCDIDASLDQAKACQPPEIPQVVATNAMLVGKIIVQKGSDTPIQIDSAFQTLFAPASASNGVVIGSVQMFAGSIAPSGYLMCQGQSISRSTYTALYNVIGNTYGIGDGSTTFQLPDLRSRFPIGAGQSTFTSTFANTDVNVSTNEITVSDNDSLYTDSTVVLSTTGTAPSPLSVGTTYYVIKISSTSIKLATTYANAIAGIAIDITTQGIGNHTLTVTYTDRVLGSVGGEEKHGLTVSEMPSHTHNYTDNYGVQNLEAIFNNGNATDEIERTETTTSTGGSLAHNNTPLYTVLNYIIKY